MHVLEHADDLRHDPAEQTGDDGDCDDRQQQRIRERCEHLLAQRIARFRIVGELVEHRIEMARLLARGDRRAENVGKRFGKFAQCLRETRALGHACAQGNGERALAFAVGLLRQRTERFIDRQARAEQGRQLSRQQRELGRAESAPRKTRSARRAFAHFVDAERIEPALAQHAAHRARGVALQNAALGLAGRVEGLVGEGGHLEKFSEWDIRNIRRHRIQIVGIQQ
jgi:hypothetical protein